MVGGRRGGWDRRHRQYDVNGCTHIYIMKFRLHPTNIFLLLSQIPIIMKYTPIFPLFVSSNTFRPRTVTKAALKKREATRLKKEELERKRLEFEEMQRELNAARAECVELVKQLVALRGLPVTSTVD